MRRLLPLLTSLSLVACGGGEVRSYRADPVPVSAPRQSHVREACQELTYRAKALYPQWPAHLPLSRDFPELPLVRLAPTVDESDAVPDLPVLTRALEEALRFDGILRLEADEEAVPPSLRAEEPQPEEGQEGEGAAPREVEAGLILRSWVDRVGRYRLRLEDRTTGRTLVSASSSVPTAPAPE